MFLLFVVSTTMLSAEAFLKMGFDIPNLDFEINAGEQFEVTSDIWGYEAFFGFDFKQTDINLGIDIAHFEFPIIQNSMKLKWGFGVPIFFDFFHFSVNLRPYGEVKCEFFADKDFGLVISARPGCIVPLYQDATSTRNVSFSIPISIGLRADADFISGILNNAF